MALNAKINLKSKFAEICLPVKKLNCGSKSHAHNIERTIADIVSKTDSQRNLKISCLRSAPTTFLIPTSFILLEAFAVDRFIKLMQAITKIKTAIRENSFTYSILLPVWEP